MAGERPIILVVDGDWEERRAIAAMLREVGFAVVAAHDHGARAAITRGHFAAAVVALPEGDGAECLRHLRRWQPGLKALSVIEPAAMRFVDEDHDAVLARPFDLRRLLGCVFELVLRVDQDAPAPHHGDIAELGIAAAKLACLDRRRITAAAAGANRLARDLARQIGQTRAMHRERAAAIASVLGLAD